MRLFKILLLLSFSAALSACVPVALAPAPSTTLPSAGHSPSPTSPAPPSSPVPMEVWSAYADEVDWSDFTEVYRLTDPVGEAFPGEFDVIIWCNEDMFDFTVTTVEYDGERFTNAETLCTIESIAPGQAVTFAAWIPESIPGTKISFLTGDGQRVERLLAWSGLDGSVHLIEF